MTKRTKSSKLTKAEKQLAERTAAADEARRLAASKGGKTTAKYGKAFRQKYSSLGGVVTFLRYGKDHFSRIAKERWQKRKRNQTQPAAKSAGAAETKGTRSRG